MLASRYRTCRAAAQHAALLAVLLLCACAHLASGEPANRVTWRPGLVSSGQPSAEQLRGLKAMHYDVVINLAPQGSAGSVENESEIVRAEGLRYVAVPVDFERPTLRDFELFSEAMNANAGRNVLVHCQANLRGSSFTFLYRVIHENAPGDEAAAKLTGVWVPNRTWMKFISETLAQYGKSVEIL